MKKKKSYTITSLGDVKLSKEMEELFEKKVKEAEEDILDARMQIRWGGAQIAIVKKAAKLMGLPYQTYLKQVVYRQALEDIDRIRRTLDNM